MIINTNSTNQKRHLEEKEVKKNSSTKAVVLLITCILLIILIIAFQLYKNYRDNFNYIKEDRSEYLVYTRYNQNKKEVPYINIKSDKIKDINNEILDYCNKYVQLDDLVITYEYSINGNYLSLIVKVLNNTSDIPEIYFETYNINLKERNIIDDKSLLNYFNITKEIASAKIHNKFVDMYQEEIEQGYLVEEECTFDDYLKIRNVDDYLNNVKYYIKNAKLYAYKEFNHMSIYGEEEYFTEESFIFQISE